MNFDIRTILIILLILLIIAAVVYVFITPPPEETEDEVLIEKLRLNSDYWNGKTVIVKGIYQLQGDGEHSLTTPTNVANPNAEDYVFLDLDTNNINLSDASEGEKYEVKGEVVVTEEGFVTRIEIIVESFEKV